MSDKTTVAFVCVQNAGRSQIATEFARRETEKRGLTSEIEVITGGTQPADEVHEVVAEAMSETGYVIDREPREIQFDELDDADYVVTMGCSASDVCPSTATAESRDWDLDDPDSQPLEEVREIRDEIRRRVESLMDEIESES
ncbi:low molecular weight phosphatase family protein [Halorutilales archaeon Cl-col2-1]